MLGFVFFVIFGLVALGGAIFGFITRLKPSPEYPNEKWIGFGTAAGAAFLALLFLMFASIKSVGSTEVGVPSQFGHISAQLGPGIHLASPFETVVKYDTKIQTYVDDSVVVQAQGGGEISVPITVRYQVANADLVYRVVGTGGAGGDVENKIVVPDVQSFVPQMAGGFGPDQLVYQASDVLTPPVANLLAKDFSAKGLHLDSVQFRKPTAKGALAEAIDQRNAAQLAVQTAQQRQNAAKVEAETAVIQAQGQAQAAQVLGQAIQQFPNVTCNSFVQGLLDGKIQGPIYTTPCPGTASVTPLVQGR